MPENPEVPEGEPTEPQQNTSQYSDEEIEAVIRQLKPARDHAVFSESLYDFVLGDGTTSEGKIENEIDDKLKEIIRGKTIVDLGCGDLVVHPSNYQGEDKLPPAIALAKHWGAGSYVGIDLYTVPEDEQELIESNRLASTIYGIKTKFVRDDMLRFVHRQPDGQNVYLISGIEWVIIDHRKYRSYKEEKPAKEYLEMTSAEICRTTTSPGAIVTYWGDLPGVYSAGKAGFKFKVIKNAIIFIRE